MKLARSKHNEELIRYIGDSQFSKIRDIYEGEVFIVLEEYSFYTKVYHLRTREEGLVIGDILEDLI